MSETKVKITFLEDCEVLDHNQEVEQSFQAGETYELPGASALHWQRRGKAEPAGGPRSASLKRNAETAAKPKAEPSGAESRSK